ncbi:hypothetical protein ACFL2O_07800 [Thermodesulfobacteriota bacterium]
MKSIYLAAIGLMILLTSCMTTKTEALKTDVNAKDFRESGCNELLRHGIYDVETTHSSDHAFMMKYTTYCGNSYFKLDKKMKADLDAEIIGIFGGTGSFDEEVIEERRNSWCRKNKELAERSSNLYTKVRSLSVEALKAWVDCRELGTEVLIKPKISPLGKFVSIYVAYNGRGPWIKFNGVCPKNFKCKILGKEDEEKIFEKAECGDGEKVIGANIQLDHQGITVYCERCGPRELVDDNVKYLVWDESNITVSTAAGLLQLFFQRDDRSDKPKWEQASFLKRWIIPPIGAVVPFFINSEEIDRMKPYWLPADGSVVYDEESPLNGLRLPNMSAKMVLGYDYDAADKKNIKRYSVRKEDAEGKNKFHVGTIDGGKRKNTKIENTNFKTIDPKRYPNKGDIQITDWKVFVHDTATNELMVSQHTHAFKLPYPSYRVLIYMVRVR